jgi:hypothetical protein
MQMFSEVVLRFAQDDLFFILKKGEINCHNLVSLGFAMITFYTLQLKNISLLVVVLVIFI